MSRPMLHRARFVCDSQGATAWRTAHNQPNEALLDATDKYGMLVWDENHRNGQLGEIVSLIRRDRNHPRSRPALVATVSLSLCARTRVIVYVCLSVCVFACAGSVIIWSLCNEVLCVTPNWTADALAGKAVMRELDPYGGRPMSANQNGWIVPDSPLDLLGFDYTTQNYDMWHSQVPNLPAIASETGNTPSDRYEVGASVPVPCVLGGPHTMALPPLRAVREQCDNRSRVLVRHGHCDVR